jgi:small subunit ribosomal protein S13
MARIAGLTIPDKKRAFVGLSYIHGVGRSAALNVLSKAQISPFKKIGELTSAEIEQIQKLIEDQYKIEGELRLEVTQNIKRLKEINSFRGSRHAKNLPVRGQRTKTNARTRKGKKVTVATSRRKLMAKAAQKT